MKLKKQTDEGCGYNALLKINSEEDLLVMDDATGVKKYAPVTKEDIVLFKREAEHLRKEIFYAIEEFKWKEEKRKSHITYYHIYQDLARQLTDFLKYIHALHKKVYISIYKSYDDELMAIYTEILKNVLDDILVIAQKHVVCFPNVEEMLYGQILCAQDIYKQCKLFGIPVEDDFSQFELRYETFISSGLNWALEKTISTVREISNDFSALYRTRFFRTDHEAVIIYHYIKRIFDERTLPDHLKHEVKVKKHRMESRRIAITNDSLQKVMDGVEDKYNNYTLCSDWFEREEDEEEELVRTLVREQASPEDFETLFKYQGEHKLWEKEIARADDFERNSDSFFVNWVDPYKLENMLKFWLKGNINKQQDWYVVWCLMKYTFHIVKDDQDKNAFAARMNLMFPEVEKKCVVDSFRKQETQKNHNHHFSEWLAESDKDYSKAHELYDKLKKEEEYKRRV